MLFCSCMSSCLFAENWDKRSHNLQKNAHLLTAAELKRRGITRYDAEILLAQGMKLPEPKASTERRTRASRAPISNGQTKSQVKTLPPRHRGRFVSKNFASQGNKNTVQEQTGAKLAGDVENLACQGCDKNVVDSKDVHVSDSACLRGQHCGEESPAIRIHRLASRDWLSQSPAARALQGSSPHSRRLSTSSVDSVADAASTPRRTRSSNLSEDRCLPDSTSDVFTPLTIDVTPTDEDRKSPLRSPRKKGDQMPRLRKEIDLSPGRKKPSPQPPEPVSTRQTRLERSKEMPVLIKEEVEGATPQSGISETAAAAAAPPMEDGDSFIDVETITPTPVDDHYRMTQGRARLCRDLREPCWRARAPDAPYDGREQEHGSQDSWSSVENHDAQSGTQDGQVSPDPEISWNTYETERTTELGLKIRSTSKSPVAATVRPSKRRLKDLHYNSELKEQHGCKVPKLTIRMRRDLDSDSTTSSTGSSSVHSQPIYEVLTSESPPTPLKRKKSKKKKRSRYSFRHEICEQSLKKGIDSTWFYGSSNKSDMPLLTAPKRFRLKFGDNAIDIPIIPNRKHLM